MILFRTHCFSKKILSSFFLAAGFVFSGCSAGHTPPYSVSQWQEKGITSLEEMELGGLSHSVLIRGTNRKNPVLLVVHGFAVPMMPFAHLDYATAKPRMPGDGELERNFIVVNYDQRGVGKTARHKAPSDSFTVKQYVDDAEELALILRKRFNKEKIFVEGISWGSLIAMQLAARHPDWFYAYISEGQAVHLVDSYMAAKRFALDEAKEEGNEEGIKDLEGTPIPSVDSSLKENMDRTETILKWADHYMQTKYGLMDLQGLFLHSLWDAPEYSTFDFLTTLKAIDSFTKATTQEALRVDMRKTVPEVKLPVYFIMGEHDLLIPAAKDYFMKLKAPAKEWIEIKKAGHAASADRPLEVLQHILRIRKTYFTNEE